MPITPEEIDLFWRRTRDELAKQALETTIELATDNVPFELYHVAFYSLGGVRVRANLAKPIDVGSPKRRYPAIISAPGYSGVAFGEALADCQRGYVLLQVYPRMQGASAQFLPRDPVLGTNWLLYGIESPDQYYYHGAFADLCRGIDYLLTRDDVDAGRIGAMGSSQGGFLSLGLAAIDNRIKAVAAHVPFLCDLRHNPCFNPAGGPDTYWGQMPTPDMDQLLSTFDYFDPVNLAPRITMPVALSSGGQDEVCPPNTIRAVFDRLPDIRSLTHYPQLSHTPRTDFFAMTWEWMRTYVKEPDR